MNYIIKLIFICLLFLIIPQYSPCAVDKPNITEGSWYEMTEHYDILIDKTEDPVATGDLHIDALTYWEVAGTEFITQTTTPDGGGGETIHCFRFTFSSQEFEATGEINGDNIILKNGSLSGELWIRTADLSTVKKKRLITGDAEAEVLPDVWINLDPPLAINQTEEYIPCLEDINWPLETGKNWNQSEVAVITYGSYILPIIGDDEFYEYDVWRVDQNCSVIENANGCNSYKVYEHAVGADSSSDLYLWWCPVMAWYARQKIEHLKLGGYGEIELGTMDVTDYQVIPSSNPAPPWIYDYNGDGTSDIAIFRAGSGLWAIRGITRVYFGSSTDKTVPGDYDGDGTTDIGIFREDSGLWALRSVSRVYFGGNSDLPQQGDYNGDDTDDLGIYRSSSGLWAIRGVTRIYFGGSTDDPIPGYYNGGGTKDIGIFRPNSGLWALRAISRIYFGGALDKTVPGYYDGDGTWETGIFRPAAGLWAIRGVTRAYFGSSSDLPVPANYMGTGADTIGIYRGSSGLWAVQRVTRVYFGSDGDIPVTR